MGKYKDADGNEIEAFTQEELDAQKKAAVDEYLKDHPDQKAALDEATKKATDLEAKIKEMEGAGDDEQKKRLIKERDDALDAAKKLTEGYGTDIKVLKDALFGGAKTKVLDKLAGSDAQLRAKIEHEYDSFKDEPKNEIEITERLTRAFTLATGKAPAPNFMDGMANGGQRGTGVTPNVATVETPNAEAQRKVLGITDEQAKKFGPEGEAAAT